MSRLTAALSKDGALNVSRALLEKPYFSVPFLVENFLGVDKRDLKTNEEIKERKKKEKEKEAKKGGGEKPAEGEAPAEEGGEAPAVTI